MKNILKRPFYGKLKTYFSTRTFLLFLFTCMMMTFTFAQQDNSKAPKVEWSSSVDLDVEDWAYEIMETSNGDYIAAGFSKSVLPANTNVRVRIPSYAVIDKTGRLKKFHVWEDGNSLGEVINGQLVQLMGDFKRVKEDSDGNLYIIGFKLDVFVDNQGDKQVKWRVAFIKLNSEYEILIEKFIDLPSDIFEAKIQGLEIYENPNNPDDNRLVVVGSGNANQGGQNEQLLLTLTFDGVVDKHNLITSSMGSGLKDCKIVDKGNGDFDIIYTGTVLIADNNFIVDPLDENSDGVIDPTGTLEMPRSDNDILVGKSNSNLDVISGFPKVFTSFGPTGGASLLYSDNVSFADMVKASYGPATPGRVPTNDPCYSPALDKYYVNNSNDSGNSILLSEDGQHFYVSGWANFVNIVEHGGAISNGKIQSNGASSPSGHPLPVVCGVHAYAHYFDADIYLLKFDLQGGLVNSQLVTHATGGDFDTPVIEDYDGNIIIGATSSDRAFADDLEDVFPDAPFANILTKVDANSLDIQWRKHFVGSGIGNCLFGLNKTSDGGYIVCGNAENADVTQSNEVENFNFVKLSPNCHLSVDYDPDYDQNLNFLPTNNTIWNSDKNIRGQVVVQSGQILRINNGATIRFADGKQLFDVHDRIPTGIRVKKGGRLIVHQNATLTRIDDCGDLAMWDGIIVEGSENVLEAGKVTINSSNLEYAIYGVFAGGRSYEVSDIQYNTSTTPPVVVEVTSLRFLVDDSKAGGQIFTTNSNYLNNFIGLRYLPFSGNSNLGNVTNCDFIQTDEDSDNYMAAISNQRTLGPKSMVYLRGIKYNLEFNRCVFDGLESLPVNDRGLGIFSVSSKIRVTNPVPNSTVNFKDLTTGISSFGLGSLSENIFVSGNIFENVLQGINLRGSFGDWIDDNKFRLSGNYLGYTWGIFTNGASAFKISNNTFTRLNGTSEFGLHLGTVINNSGDDGALTWRNEYDDIFVAKQFERNNSEIDNFCNLYEDIRTSWVVAPEPGGNDEMKDQGEFLGNKPDNQFIGDCLPTSDVYSNLSFGYFDKTGNPNPIADGDQSGSSICVLNTNYEIVDLPTPLECEDADDPCDALPCLLSDHETQYENSNGEKSDRNQLLRTYLHAEEIEVNTSPDFSGEVESIQFLNERGEEEDKRVLVASYTEQKDYSSANYWLSQLNDNSSEFVTFYSTLINAGLDGRDIYQLEENEYSTLLSFLDSETSISEKAKLVDYLVNGNIYPLTPQYYNPDDNAEDRANRDTENTSPINNRNISVHPNPFKEVVTFDFGTDEAVELVITDITGREVWNAKTKGQEKLDWTPVNIENGVYYYTIRFATGTNEVGKVIYIK